MKKVMFLMFCFLLPLQVFSQELQGIGYGNTRQEAKEEALADLSSSIKVQVFSKYEQTSLKEQNKAYSRATKYTKLTTNIPLISPSVIYLKENGMNKAIASIDNPEVYAEKLTDIAGKIDTVTKEVSKTGDKTLNYKLLMSAKTLYDEYESYRSVAMVLGVTGYKSPRIPIEEAESLILSMQESPPSLEVAAEVLTKDMDEKDIYVSPPVVAGSQDVTEFGSFFKDLLSAKVNSVKVEEDGRYKLNCSYSRSKDDLVMACSLITGVSKVLKSTITKIPLELVSSMDTAPKKSTVSILNKNDLPKTDYKIWIKISTEGDPNFLREQEPFSLLVKANKSGYVYFVMYNNAKDGDANILGIDWNDTFIKYIDEKHVNKWVSLGQFRVKAPYGTGTLYGFGLTNKPDPANILPEYAQKNIGYLKNIRPEVLLQDVYYLFRRQTGDKTTTSIQFQTAPNRKKE